MENKAIKLFVDMDGTLATWKLAASMEELLQKNYFRDLPPYQVQQHITRLCGSEHLKRNLFTSAHWNLL